MIETILSLIQENPIKVGGAIIIGFGALMYYALIKSSDFAKWATIKLFWIIGFIIATAITYRTIT